MMEPMPPSLDQPLPPPASLQALAALLLLAALLVQAGLRALSRRRPSPLPPEDASPPPAEPGPGALPGQLLAAELAAEAAVLLAIPHAASWGSDQLLGPEGTRPFGQLLEMAPSDLPLLEGWIRAMGEQVAQASPPVNCRSPSCAPPSARATWPG